MHFYNFHIGDYAAHTSHLDPIEDIAYRRMMDWCYLNESPLPESIEEITRLIRMRGHATDVERVLNEFWKLVENGWIQERIISETETYQNKKKQASKAGRASAKARKAKRNKDLDTPTDVQRTFNGRSTDVVPTKNQEPLTKNQEPHIHIRDISDEDVTKPQRKPIPFNEIVSLYHEILPELPRCEKLTDARKGAIRQRWLHDLPDLNNWENFFHFVKDSPFLTGKTEPREGKRPFRASLEWLTKQGNYAKILEGNYHG